MVNERITEDYFREHIKKDEIYKNKKIILNTKTRFEFIDITGEVEDFISSSGILNGQVLIYSKHTTLAIVINEKETGIFQDSEEFFKII